MPTTACITTFDLADLPAARVLAQSVRAAHPTWRLHAVLLDELPDDLPAGIFADFDTVVPVAALDIPRFPGWIFGHDRMTARLPAGVLLLGGMLGREADLVVYLDAGSAVFHPLDLESGPLAAASILLAPQQIEPNDFAPALRDGELASMRQGIYSPAFLAACNDRDGLAFAAWLAGMMGRHQADSRLGAALPGPLFCNLAPALFDNVRVIRDPGYNVGGVNISRRRIAVGADGGIGVNGVPLRFMVFPSAGSPEEAMMERYGRGDIELYELMNWHRRQLARHAMEQRA